MIGIILMNITGAIFSADIIRTSIRKHDTYLVTVGIILLIGNLLSILIHYPKIS